MADIEGKPLYQRLTERLRGLLPLVWCIPEGDENDRLNDALQAHGYEVFRGSYSNVHKRVVDCADHYNFGTIVRVTGDNPLTDPQAMMTLVNQHMIHGSDYTYAVDMPKGTKCEIVEIERMRHTCEHKEHLTYDFMTYGNRYGYRTGIGYADLRLTVDYPVDLERIRKIYRKLGDRPCLEDVISMFYSENGQKESITK